MARTATRLVAAARSYHPDPVVARLQASLEEAFHRRRSLLLLNYETQVRAEGLRAFWGRLVWLRG